MDKYTEKILNRDSIAESEKLLGGKHHSNFDDVDITLTLLKCMSDNTEKENHLKSIGDTYNGIKWGYFKSLLTTKGFVNAYSYDFTYEPLEINTIEEAILYYNPSKGLIIFATSFGNKDRINGGNLYGEIQAFSEEHKETIWKWISTGGCIDQKNMIYETSHDVREGLFSKIEKLESAGQFLNKWTAKNRFLWFVDFVEEKNPSYDYKKITQDKIQKCCKEFRNIIGK